jgi:hypothetical protein
VTIYYKATFIDSSNNVRLHETEIQGFNGTYGELFKDLVGDYGRCTGHVYVDHIKRKEDPPTKVGWVFVKRIFYDDRESYGHSMNKKNSFVQETWVTCYDGKPVTTQPRMVSVV